MNTIAAFRNRIPLSPGFHAEPGATPGHLHDVYTTREPLCGNRRIHVGQLSKDAVDAWASSAGQGRGSDDGSALQDDLRELLDILGLPSGAQPRSPHEVFQSALGVLRQRFGL